MSSAETPRKVLAAVDNSLAGNPVLVTARALARVLGARVEGIYVAADSEPPPHSAAAAVGFGMDPIEGLYIVALASEEIAIRKVVDREIETYDPYEGAVMVWTT
jgi:nucleotide-binding universal stress UspA family protein